MDLRVRPQLLSSYIAPIERRGCHRSMRLMRWLSQQLGDVADKANGQVIMPYACGHVQGKVKRRCRVNLLEGGAIGEHADHHIEQFLVRLMVDRLLAELDMLPEGREEISRLQKGSQCRQGSILCTTVHG